MPHGVHKIPGDKHVCSNISPVRVDDLQYNFENQKYDNKDPVLPVVQD